jgi:GNAT superfamily N-acetyltransferase
LDITVRQLKPELVDDFLRFFDKEAFTDFPEWSGCYCGFYETPGTDWEAGPEAAPTHRIEKAERIRAGRATGFLAYADGKVVGWCNGQRRSNFANMRRYSVVVDDPAEPVASIMCFLVAPGYRGRRVGTSLLNSACDVFRLDGLKIAEGYPTTHPPKRDWEIPWAEENYKGPLSIYLKNGFKIHRQFERFAVVRRQL